MAQLTEPMFSINGVPLMQFTSFALNQSIFSHHEFTLICPAQSIDGTSGMFTSSKEMIGGSFGARITGIGLKGTLLFNGIITGIETARFTGHHGDVIIRGYSPTIVLDSGPHCKSWEKKALKNIAQDVLKFFPQNLLEPKVQPLYGETLAYTVQYKETAWQFLQRLTGSYGEWLFWDGRSLVIGPPRGAEKTELIYGRHLSSFNVSMEARATQQQLMGWDYLNSQVYTSEPQGVEQKAGLNPWGEQAYKASQTVYGTQPKQWNNKFLTNKKQQDDLVTLRSAVESSKLVQFRGQSGHPGVMLGGRVEVSGSNVFSAASEGYGEYLITAVSHHVDGQGHYENHFTAVPSSIKVAPITVPRDPVCETQSAIVTDNNDYNGLGRVRVKFHWMNGSEKTPWIRVTSPHGGGEKGHFFIPEIGEEVMVGFESESPTKPYVIGTVYHGSANTSFSNAGNDIKTIRTRSGHMVEFSDAGSGTHIIIRDPGGNEIYLDTTGKNITITAPETMTFNAKNMHFNVTENMTSTIGKDKATSVGQNQTVSIGKDHVHTTGRLNTVTVGGDSMLNISGKLTEMIEGDVHSEAKQERVESSHGDFNLSSKQSLLKHAQKVVQNNSGENGKAN
ncbi:type VI secretion system Vgr family protein [Niabella beijingensis]|uniref:type VI secretion system Vgr family protein n=1 Tax=Niabella beijingensis TaxID=2872700 RepID=UPI001CBEFD77|nr:type VI secretion system Vgr family protein [Niabella beijingensis]MBZ4188642.1 type VI secretion system Vgr family protein [Niabella beijingensis]